MDTQFATGIASRGNGFDAGQRAAAEAYEKLDTDRVDFCHVFSSPRYDYSEVFSGIRDVVGDDADIFGCSSTGEFTESAVRTGSVALALVTSDTVQFESGVGTGLSHDVMGAVQDATETFSPSGNEYPHRAAINLHDGLAGVGEQLALLTQQRLGYNVSLAGGSAGDDRHMNATHVFCDDTALRDATAISEIRSEDPIVVTVNHGHVPISEPMVITDSKGSIVREINDRPAFEVWKETVQQRARDEFGVDVSDLRAGDEELTRMLTAYQFGIEQGAELKIRWPGATQTTNGLLRFPVNMPEGTVVKVMHSPPDRQLEAIETVAQQAQERAGDIDVAGAFVYDCFCRSAILRDEFPTAIEVLAEGLDVPFVGVETYGEVCMEVGQMSGYHNSTAVIVLLPA